MRAMFGQQVVRLALEKQLNCALALYLCGRVFVKGDE
jgi:hypothetical protein